jgi:hypothetical protein
MEVTLDALEAIYRDRRGQGWALTVYDYVENRWYDGEEAFQREGTYELAVLVDPGGRRVRVRLNPTGSWGIRVDAASAGEMAVWRAMGMEPKGDALALLRDLLEGRTGLVDLEELDSMMAATSLGGGEARAAQSFRRAMAGLLGERSRDGEGGGDGT